MLRHDETAQPSFEVQSLPGVAEAITAATTLDMRAGGNGAAYLARGWSEPETPGIWTVGARAELVAALADWHGDMVLRVSAVAALADWHGDMVLRVSARPFLVPDRHPELKVDVLANGTTVGRWSYDVAQDNHPVTRTVRIPAALLAASPLLRIEFQIDRPAIPAVTADNSTDSRELGLFVSRIDLDREALSPLH
jgi:hypothetical protein